MAKREYQFEAVKQALMSNTIVCLPTGMGKTFIASVVMYNLMTWFPGKKVVFVAPTRPLVAQQIDACANIMKFDPSCLAEVTGSTPPPKRKKLWDENTVLFATAQTINNDIAKSVCPVEDICCLVLDEAHHATQNHAYALIAKQILGSSQQCRLLGLTATPGSEVKQIQEVIHNLKVANLFVRDLEDPDVKPYVFKTQVDIEVVEPCNKINRLSKMLNKMMVPPQQRLTNARAMAYTDVECLPRFAVLKAMEDFRKAPQNRSNERGFAIQGDFGLLIALLSCRECLQGYGIGCLQESIENNFGGSKKISRSKKNLIHSAEFIMMRNLIEEYLTEDVRLCHPKLQRLEEILLHHFKQAKRESRVIVFTEYRSSVEEIVRIVNRHAPNIRAMKFIGRGGSSKKGLTQKQQLQIVESFRKGNYNTLVCTSIAEEGLDIGEVDLILFFDYKKSPIRTTQRMGRTGRKRVGRCVVLLTRGREEQSYQRNHTRSKSLNDSLKKRSKGDMFRGRKLDLYDKNEQRMFSEAKQLVVVYEERTRENDGPFEFAGQKTKKQRKVKKGQFQLTKEEQGFYDKFFAVPYRQRLNTALRSLDAFCNPDAIGRIGHSTLTQSLINMANNMECIQLGLPMQTVELIADRIVPSLSFPSQEKQSTAPLPALPPRKRGQASITAFLQPSTTDTTTKKKRRIDIELTKPSESHQSSSKDDLSLQPISSSQQRLAHFLHRSSPQATMIAIAEQEVVPRVAAALFLADMVQARVPRRCPARTPRPVQEHNVETYIHTPNKHKPSANEFEAQEEKPHSPKRNQIDSELELLEFSDDSFIIQTTEIRADSPQVVAVSDASSSPCIVRRKRRARQPLALTPTPRKPAPPSSSPRPPVSRRPHSKQRTVHRFLEFEADVESGDNSSDDSDGASGSLSGEFIRYSASLTPRESQDRYQTHAMYLQSLVPSSPVSFESVCSSQTQ